MLRKLETLDRTKNHRLNFDRVFYSDKLKEFNGYINEAKKTWEYVKVEYYNGTTIPHDRVFLILGKDDKATK
mgnify:FL=1